MPNDSTSNSHVSFAEKVGDNLKRIRAAADVTQGELARAVGVSTHTIQAWEQGYRLLPMMAFERIGRRLGMTPIELFKEVFPRADFNESEPARV